jgi:hypothetical protein
MPKPKFRVERFDKASHDREAFSCGAGNDLTVQSQGLPNDLGRHTNTRQRNLVNNLPAFNAPMCVDHMNAAIFNYFLV